MPSLTPWREVLAPHPDVAAGLADGVCRVSQPRGPQPRLPLVQLSVDTALKLVIR